MVFFTTPELMEIGELPFVSPHEKPNRLEALRYYRRVTDRFGLDVRLGEPVTGLAHAARGGFEVVSNPGGPGGRETTSRQAPFVVVASGAYDLPNRLGVRGEDLPHVSHYYREAHVHYRQRVVIVGGKNSAAEAALELHRAGRQSDARPSRQPARRQHQVLGQADIENRIAEGSIRARFNTRVVEITPTHVVLEGPEGPEGNQQGRPCRRARRSGVCC
jgi:thioredoxin reductase (NADPH)